MNGMAVVGATCTGQYHTQVGDKRVWLPVAGQITKGSRTVFSNGAAAAFNGSEVRMDTQNGPKFMRVDEGSGSLNCELGPVAMFGDKVTGDRFKDGKISGNCSKKVFGQ